MFAFTLNPSSQSVVGTDARRNGKRGPATRQLQHYDSHNRTKIVPSRDTFHRLKIYLNSDCGRGCAPDPIGKAYGAPGLPAVFRGSASQRRKETAEWTGQEERGGERKKGMEREGKRWRGNGGGWLCSLLQEFLRATIIVGLKLAQPPVGPLRWTVMSNVPDSGLMAIYKRRFHQRGVTLWWRMTAAVIRSMRTGGGKRDGNRNSQTRIASKTTDDSECCDCYWNIADS